MPIFIIFMMALVQLIFQGLAYKNLHFVWLQFPLFLLQCFSVFLDFSFQAHRYHFLPVSSPISNAGLPVCGWSAFWQVHPHPHTSVCCLLPSACAWLSQGCAQPVLHWLLFAAALSVSSGIHAMVLWQSPTITPAHLSVSLHTASLFWLGLFLYCGLQPPLVYIHSFNSPHFPPHIYLHFSTQ